MLAKMSRKLKTQGKQLLLAGYCRKSTDEKKKQIHSIPDQELRLEECLSRLPEELTSGRKFKKYASEKISAFHPRKRMVFNEIMEDAEKGEIYALIASDFTRVSRNPEDTGRVIQLLKDGRLVCFIASTTGRIYWGHNSNDIMMLSIEGGISCKDSMDKGAVVKDRMTIRAKEGKHMGRKPFGFKLRLTLMPDGSELRETVDDEGRLPHLIKFYKLVATGAYSLSDLEALTDKEGITARPAANNPTGKLKRSALAHMLHDPYYKGEVWFDGKFQGRWTDNPPVSESLWNRVQIVLSDRNRNTSRTKNQQLRRLFMYGSVMKCGKCGGHLSPYRIVKKKTGKMYVYYECKAGKGCKTLIEQSKLVAQNKAMQDAVLAGGFELDAAREGLLKLHKEKAKEENSLRDGLEARYKKLQEEITDLLMQMKKAEALGVSGEIDAQIKKLVLERDEINAQLNQTHEESSAWIEKALKCFELLRSAQEMLLHGSPKIREGVMKAIASNYSVTDGKLVPDLRSPFRETLEKGERVEWWTILDSNQ